MTFFRLLALTLVPAMSCLADRGPVPSTRPEDVARQQKFARIWEQRFQKDVSMELLPFVDDPAPELAGRAVRALGRLEKPSVLPELEKRRDAQNAQPQAGRTDPNKRPTRYIEFDTAIARIQSRNLHGEAKVEFVLKNMKPSWTWQEARQWSQKVTDPRNYLATSLEACHVREIVDLFYTMSKNGENIEPLRQQFTFSKAQNVQLDGAKLPLAKEAEHLLDYAQSLDLVRMDDEYVCESHLLSLGEPARVALQQRMQLLLKTKPKFTNRNPFVCLLQAAAMTGDDQFKPLLEAFQSGMNYVNNTYSDAQQAKERLADKNAYSFAPQ